ncbi:MAG: chromosome partitioning protein ParB [Candidatus Poribacteria bacterium]|nr:chromosome partitioning protein ParB [Candidatus Poribacteria bacterium]
MSRPKKTCKHSRLIDGARYIWYARNLWKLAEGLPVKEVDISAIRELDADCWFGDGYVPTIRKVAEHCKKIIDADLDYPIILNADGYLMDGGHRIAKALIQGQTKIKAVQFEIMPTPDVIVPTEP